MRRIVVTGANKGIGLAVVRAILSTHADAFVYLGSRDRDRGDAARASLGDLGERVEVVGLDVSDPASITAAAERIDGPLYGLVNNAGIGEADLAAILAVNTLGPRRVCEALLPKLVDGGRVVNVSSASGPMFVSSCSPVRQRELTDPAITLAAWDVLVAEYLASGSGNPYGVSKALLNAYTLWLARTTPRLYVNACTPGFIETDMTRRLAGLQGTTPAAMGTKPVSEGTRSTMHLLFGDVGTGWYYGSDAVRSPLDRYRSPGDPPYEGS